MQPFISDPFFQFVCSGILKKNSFVVEEKRSSQEKFRYMDVEMDKQMEGRYEQIER